MSTTTPPVGISIVLPACATTATTPRTRVLWLGVEPPGRKLLSGEVTTRTGGTHVPPPPTRQSPYWTLNAPLGSCEASVISRPWKVPPSQYTGYGARSMLSRMLCGIGFACTTFPQAPSATEQSAASAASAASKRALGRTPAG